MATRARGTAAALAIQDGSRSTPREWDSALTVKGVAYKGVCVSCVICCGGTYANASYRRKLTVSVYRKLTREWGLALT
eukprot:5168668-Pyramimonas_sp.AAC.1